MVTEVKASIDLLVYLGLLLGELLARSAPPRVARGVAEGVGRLWYRLDGRRRRRAAENLRIAEAGGLEVLDRDALIRRSFQALMHVPLEVMTFPRYLRHERDVLRRCRFYGDWAAFRDDLDAGKGGVFVSGHLGSWELAAWVLRFLDVPSRVVTRPIENPWVERHTFEARGGLDRVIHKRGAIRAMQETLRRKGWVGILADQNAGRRGTFVPFFGLSASTAPTPVVLAARARVPIYAAASLRRRDAPFTFEIHLRRLPGPSEEHLRQFMEALEGWIRLAPDQYNWVHRRWKARPAGEPPGAHVARYDR